jgi:hypothetical protein
MHVLKMQRLGSPEGSAAPVARQQAVDREVRLGIYVVPGRASPLDHGEYRPATSSSARPEEPMDRRTRTASKRRYILQRAQDLLGRLSRMDDEELRWTVRVFADCLSPAQRAACLGAYDERWPIEERRRLMTGFVQRYTALALEALERSEAAPGGGLASLTDEDLQGMSLAEKWLRVARDPMGLAPDQLRRELARLFMCKSYDLFHDAGLSEAAVEYPAYHRVREALESQPDGAVADLAGLVVRQAIHLSSQNAHEVETALRQSRDAIGAWLGLTIPPDRLFGGQMVPLPLEDPDQVAESTSADRARPSWEMPGADLATALLVVADLMTQQEVEEHLLPLRRQFRSIADVPGPELRALLSRIWALVGDRRLTDFAERYRSGRMVAERKVAPEVWRLLSHPEQLAILERDNRTMDVGQAARHLAKIFFSFQYDSLCDAGFHVDLLRSPGYQQFVSRLTACEDGMAARRLAVLTETVTRQMLELQTLAPDARRTRLQEVRTLIAATLDLPDDLTYPAGREGRA